MKKFLRERSWLILIFLSASVLIYFLHYLIFRDVHHIFIYMVGDLGFLFLDVMLVVIVIEQLLVQREKKTRLHKLNMLIGAFFSEVGHSLVRQFIPLLQNVEEIKEMALIKPDWQKHDFLRARKAMAVAPLQISAKPENLLNLRNYLQPRRSFLLSLLANPSLLEHESFTDLLWAIFHLAEELTLRPEEMTALPPSDLDHLNNDIKRAAILLLEAWINYAAHLKESYPFLFSLLLRVNPFLPEPKAVVS